MIKMTIEELFNVGVSFESCVGDGTKGERLRIPKNLSRLHLSENLISEIQEFKKELKFLVSGEIWCPDFQLNATIVNKFCELNPNFDISIISTARGKKFLAPILEIENFKGPSIVILDNNYNILGLFEERPKIVANAPSFDDIKLEYYKGKYLLDSVNDFLEIMRQA
ncbi:thioredoxin family protein [Clostridium sp. CCUG 7971]|uniref:thioredoxin family protein n=1 Tax=Clostridium sp. CCUG 7971 TaxID=2811414 RepID=UPI001ABB52C6|nr:thioredoxin family protein [Clostridium sp. CCUG 7971]MBO3446311.1 thioredoxin family protein [Clostridium sp. CCUG 7971]